MFIWYKGNTFFSNTLPSEPLILPSVQTQGYACAPINNKQIFVVGTQKTSQLSTAKQTSTMRSQLQQETAQTFLSDFPSANDVLAFFNPSHWSYCLIHLDLCLSSPNVTLGLLDETYKYEGLARNVTLANLTGLYQMSRCTATSFDNSFLNTSADLFVANNPSCTMYGMMLYFAKYMSDFKSTYKDFDFSDILQSYRSKFVPWWNNRLRLVQPQETKQEDDNKPTGKTALVRYLEDYASKGYDITQGGLYKYGFGSMHQEICSLIDSLMEKYKDTRTTF